jgi:hypothetical protein
MAKLYLDENVDAELCDLLIAYGHDVVSVFKAGKSGDSDEAVMTFASNENRAVVTHNRRHFLRLHKTHAMDHSGIIVCTYDPDLNALALHIHEAVTQHEPLAGKLIRVIRTNP